MGQKVNPIGLRLGIIRGWDSNWYGGNNYADKIIEDEKIRKYLLVRVPKGGIARSVIERTLKRITITIHTARPGIVIGKGGQEVDKIKEELKQLTKKEVQINIYEVKKPDLDAKLVADNVASQLEARISFRRAVKSAIAATMRAGAEGIKIRVSGRIGGAEMARSEQYKEGRTPLHTLRADVDYALSEALTVYGKLGVKVWLCRGEIYGKRDLSPNVGLEARNEGGNASGGFRGRERNDDRRERPDRRSGGGDRRGGSGAGGDRRGGGAGGNRGGNGGGGFKR